MTPGRALLLSGLSAGLGAVATGGLRLLDSRVALAGSVGSALVLGVALIVDAVQSARRPWGEAQELRAEIRVQVEGLHSRLDIIEAKLSGLGRQSFTGGAGGTGSGPAVSMR